MRAGVLADLVLRPWDTSRPPVTAELTVVVPLSALDGSADEPAEVEGRPITAAHLRELLEQLAALGPGEPAVPTGGSLDVDLVERRTGRLRAALTHRELVRAGRRGCRSHPAPDGVAGCTCSAAGIPAAVDRYTPSPAQRRFVRHRDRGCRHPGCRSRVGRTDLDHVRPHPDGPTDCHNLCCLCRRHHRLKTHAPGWRFELTPDGVLLVTTPSGVTRTTRPPGLRHAAERAQGSSPPAPPRPACRRRSAAVLTVARPDPFAPPAPPGRPPLRGALFPASQRGLDSDRTTL